MIYALDRARRATEVMAVPSKAGIYMPTNHCWESGTDERKDR